MQKLVEGIHRFQAEYFAPNRLLFERLARKQEPEVLFITCSDSRISPNLLTQTEPGELFIMRNAGNIVPPPNSGGEGEEATLEFAVGGLGVKDVVVCGHSHCGAMKALLDPAQTSTLPAMTRWLRHAEATRRIIDENYQHLEGPARVMATVEENVLVQLEHVRTHPTVAARLGRGQLRLHGWVYKIETGEVFAFQPDEGQFMRIGAGLAPSVEVEPRRLGSLI